MATQAPSSFRFVKLRRGIPMKRNIFVLKFSNRSHIIPFFHYELTTQKIPHWDNKCWTF
jgi:hypothetical protein